MTNRPRSHVLQDLSRNRLHDIFVGMGWTVEDIHSDYGLDLLVQIFKDGRITPFSFFVQAKATDNINRYMRAKGSRLSFPVDTGHVKYWRRLPEPVILTVWDAEVNTTYWEPIQRYLEQSNTSKRFKGKTVIEIPADNVLDEKGITQITSYTKLRFNRLVREREGAQTLLRYLDELGVKVEYKPEAGYIFKRTDVNGTTYIEVSFFIRDFVEKI